MENRLVGISSCWGLEVGEGGMWVLLLKDQGRICHDGYVLYIDRINVNILAVTLNYSFARCIIGRNWVTGTWPCSVLFLRTRTESTMTSK